MSIVVKNYSLRDRTSLWIFPEKAENIAGLMTLTLDQVSSRQEAVLRATRGDESFQWLLRGTFDFVASGDALSDFVSKNQSAELSSVQIYRDNALWMEYTFTPGSKLSELIPGVLSSDQVKVYREDDVFQGSLQFADYVNGYAGNDRMSGFGATPTGLDIFFGGDGVDTAVFPGARSDYVVSASNSIWNPVLNTADLVGYKVTNKAKPDFGNADLHQVERLQFSDFSVALDSQGSAGQAFRIYRAAFDRIPDTIGLGYWIAQMDKGMGVVEVAARFIDSKEFRELYGANASSADFLTKVYSNVLDRNPDSVGLAWWVNEMTVNPAKTWQKVLADFSESAENQTNVASLIANGIDYTPWG